LHAVGANETPVALFLDGPKGRVAVRLALEALQRFQGLRVAAVHDVPRRDPRYCDMEGRHLTRLAMEQAPFASVFSDEPWFVAHFGLRLDAGVWRPDTTNTTGSYGPTLGALVRAWHPAL